MKGRVLIVCNVYSFTDNCTEYDYYRVRSSGSVCIAVSRKRCALGKMKIVNQIKNPYYCTRVHVLTTAKRYCTSIMYSYRTCTFYHRVYCYYSTRHRDTLRTTYEYIRIRAYISRTLLGQDEREYTRPQVSLATTAIFPVPYYRYPARFFKNYN